MSHLKNPRRILMQLYFLTFGNICDMRWLSLMKSTIHLSGDSCSNPETTVTLHRCFFSFVIFISHSLLRFYNFIISNFGNEKKKKLCNFYFLYFFQLHFSSHTFIKNSL